MNNVARNWPSEPPTKPVDNISNRDLARRDALRWKLHRAIDEAIERGDAGLDALADMLAGGGAQ